jgi:hypothetical protein
MSSRISELERELRRTRVVGICGILLVAAVTLSAFGRGHAEVVRAERVELVDSKGVRHALLAADSAGFVVTVLDERDRPAGSFRLTGEPRVTVEESDGSEVAGLGAPKVHNLTE